MNSAENQCLVEGSHMLDEECKVSEKDQDSEKHHFYSVISSFSQYEKYSFFELGNIMKQWGELDPRYRKLLPNYSKKFDCIKEGIRANYNLILCIIAHYIEEDLRNPSIFQGQNIRCSTPKKSLMLKRNNTPVPPDFDMEKVKGTLKQFVREWSDEGKEERSGFKRIISILNENYPNKKTRSNIRVLTPGCGLGRITFEIARNGYFSQGNEFSFQMLLASNLILNNLSSSRKFIIYPFIHQRSNALKQNDAIRGISIPDLNPSNSNLEGDNLSIVMGEFIEVYNNPKYYNQWDCVVTYFFLDTARVIFKYIETIQKIMKRGGIWINYGPLLYHYSSNDGSNMSVELTYQEMIEVIKKVGFEVTDLGFEESKYCSNTRSMMKVVYKCGVFIAKKL